MARKPITLGKDLGPALLRALGYDIEDHHVQSFHIYWRARRPPLIRITEFATVEQEEHLLHVLSDVTAAGDRMVRQIADEGDGPAAPEESDG